MENITETEQKKEDLKVPKIQEKMTITPGQMRVIKRNGSVVPYNQEKIAIAITKAFLAVEGGAAAASTRIHNKVTELANAITITFSRRMPSGGTLHIEEIQDQVELELMRSEERKVARSYVLYREERTKARKLETEEEEEQEQEESGIRVILDDGTEANLDISRMNVLVKEACDELNEVIPEEIIEEAFSKLFSPSSKTREGEPVTFVRTFNPAQSPNFHKIENCLNNLQHPTMKKAFQSKRPLLATRQSKN